MTSATDTRRGIEDVLDHPLGDEQWAAVSAPLQPGAIVAGAGSGKTTVMAARVLWLVLEGYAEPDRILGLTFTTKAAAELLGRARRLLATADRLGLPVGDSAADSSTPAEPSISTYHAFAARLLVDHGVRLGLEPGTTVLADGARQALAAQVLRATALPLASLGSSPSTLLSAMLHFDDTLAELDLEPVAVLDDAIDFTAWLESIDSLQQIGRQMLDTARVRAALCGLVDEFRAAKMDRQVIDFADQVRLALRVVRTSPEVRTQLRAHYSVVLLDEYQDTSVAQRRLLQAVFADGHPVTAVGDPCQAIYEWRGASVDNIDHFPEHFPVVTDAGSRPAQRYPLADNRRSAPRILDLANALAEPLRARHPGVEPLRAAATNRGSGVIRCALLPTYADEIEWVCDQIQALHAAQGTWTGITVLARKGETLVDVDRALRARDVPTQLVGVAGLLDVPAVAEVRAIMEVLDDPAANVALMRILTGARWRIGPRDLAALGTLTGAAQVRSEDDVDVAPGGVERGLREAVLGIDPCDRISLWEVIESVADSAEALPTLSVLAVERLRRLVREMRWLRRHLDEAPVDLIGRILRATGLGVEMAVGPAAVDNARAMAAFSATVPR